MPKQAAAIMLCCVYNSVIRMVTGAAPSSPFRHRPCLRENSLFRKSLFNNSSLYSKESKLKTVWKLLVWCLSFFFFKESYLTWSAHKYYWYSIYASYSLTTKWLINWCQIRFIQLIPKYSRSISKLTSQWCLQNSLSLVGFF